MNSQPISISEEKRQKDYGFVKSRRDKLESPFWKNSTSVQKVVFEVILHRASYKADTVPAKGRRGPVELKPGQYFTTIEKLAELCGKDVTISAVRTSIAKLIKYGLITKEGIPNRYTIITVTGWNELYGEHSRYDAKHPIRENKKNEHNVFHIDDLQKTYQPAAASLLRR